MIAICLTVVIASAVVCWAVLWAHLRPVVVAWCNARVQLHRAQEAQARLAEVMTSEQQLAFSAQIAKAKAPAPAPAAPAAPPAAPAGGGQVANKPDDHVCGPECGLPVGHIASGGWFIRAGRIGLVSVPAGYWPASGLFRRDEESPAC